MFSAILASQGYTFIGGPPITTVSIAMIFLNFGLFIVSFSTSIIFQGWFVSVRHTEIKFSESALQSFYLKFAFLFYALPVLLLSDIFGFLPFLLLEKIPVLKDAINNMWFFGILYFSLGLALITYIVSKLEFHIFSNKWPDVEKIRFRHTVIISNTLIFAIALILAVVSKEYMT